MVKRLTLSMDLTRDLLRVWLSKVAKKENQTFWAVQLPLNQQLLKVWGLKPHIQMEIPAWIRLIQLEKLNRIGPISPIWLDMIWTQWIVLLKTMQAISILHQL